MILFIYLFIYFFTKEDFCSYNLTSFVTHHFRSTNKLVTGDVSKKLI